jgi:lysine 2,3-aminomutase
MNNSELKIEEGEPPSKVEKNSENTAQCGSLDGNIIYIPVSKSLINKFPQSQNTKNFIKKFYPGISSSDWNDWKWQVRNRIRTTEHLSCFVDLTDEERKAVDKRTANLPIAITPYYLSLLDPQNPMQSLRRTHIPVGDEFIQTPGEDPDPLGEDHDTATPGLVHRYPDRVLFFDNGLLFYILSLLYSLAHGRRDQRRV